MKVFGWLAILVWAAVLYGGVKTSSRSAVLCTTLLDLPQNHMLKGEDLTCPISAATRIYEGRYLKHQVAKNTAISPDDVNDSPVLRIASDSTIVVMILSSDQAKKVDADQHVDLGTDSVPIVKQSRVIAVLCARTVPEQCRLALEVPQSALKSLVDAAGQVGIVDATRSGPSQNNGAGQDGQHK